MLSLALLTIFQANVPAPTCHDLAQIHGSRKPCPLTIRLPSALGFYTSNLSTSLDHES